MNRNRKIHSLGMREKARILDLSHIFIRDMDNKIILWNTNAEQLYGWAKEDAVGIVAHELLKTVFPEPLEAIMTKLLIDKSWQGQLVHTSRDGKNIFIASHWELFCNEHGNPIAILEINNDITEQKYKEWELKESEMKFRALVEQIPNKIIYMSALDERSTTLYISPQINNILGYKPEEYMEDPDIWAKVIHPDDRERVITELQLSKKKDEPFVAEYRMIRKDGQAIWVDNHARIVKNHLGEPIFLLGVNTDITGRKYSEEALRETEKELEIKTHDLQEVNTALKVLLKRREEDKALLEQQVLTNCRELVKPFIEKLKKAGLDEKQKTLLNILESNINEIIAPFAHSMSSPYFNLTPTEIKIANLIKHGKTSKEICELLDSSLDAVSFHRRNIRYKLGLKGRKINLKSYLISKA